MRRLRIARGLTQTELANGRFTKEYMSQIERGRVRPTAETLDWLAERLGVERAYLETGVSSEESERAASLVLRAEAAIASSQFDEALPCLDGLAESIAGRHPELELRALLAESTARTHGGELDVVLALLEDARSGRRARLHRSRSREGALPPRALPLQDGVDLDRRRSPQRALELIDRSGLADDRLVASALRWRSRCYRRQRDWVAAREDVERALELARASTTGAPWPTATSRRRSSPSETGSGSSRDRTRSAPRRCTRSRTTGSMSDAC